MTPAELERIARAKGLKVEVSPCRLPQHKPKREILTGQPIRWAVEFSIPCIVVSESNQSNRERWQSKMRRRHAQRDALHGALVSIRLLSIPPAKAYRITWTKVGGRKLDDDNLRSAAKALRDHLTAWMGFESDDDERLMWVYSQRPGGESPGVECRIELRET